MKKSVHPDIKLFSILLLLLIIFSCTNSVNNSANSLIGVKEALCIDTLINSNSYNRYNNIEVGKLNNLDFYNGYRGLHFGMSLDSISLISDFERDDRYSSRKIKIFNSVKSVKNNLLSGYLKLTFYEDKLRIILFKSYSDDASGKLIKMFGQPNTKYFFKSNRDSLIRDFKRSNPTSNLMPEWLTYSREYSYSNYIWRTENIELDYSDTINFSMVKRDPNAKSNIERHSKANLMLTELKYKKIISQLKSKCDDSLKIELKNKSERNFIEKF